MLHIIHEYKIKLHYDPEIQMKDKIKVFTLHYESWYICNFCRDQLIVFFNQHLSINWNIICISEKKKYSSNTSKILKFTSPLFYLELHY